MKEEQKEELGTSVIKVQRERVENRERNGERELLGTNTHALAANFLPTLPPGLVDESKNWKDLLNGKIKIEGKR